MATTGHQTTGFSPDLWAVVVGLLVAILPETRRRVQAGQPRAWLLASAWILGIALSISALAFEWDFAELRLSVAAATICVSTLILADGAAPSKKIFLR